MRTTTLLTLAISGASLLSACGAISYDDIAVSDLDTLAQQHFCNDAAAAYTKLARAEGVALCALTSLLSGECESEFDNCVAQLPDTSEIGPSTAGVLYGSDACMDLFSEGAWSDCAVNADDYVACVDESQESVNGLTGSDVCDVDGGADTGGEESTSASCQLVEELCSNNPMSTATIAAAVSDNTGK